MNFHKYHGLGNDYIVLDPADVGPDLTADRVRLICHRNFGVGSDGILLGPFTTADGGVRLRILNPDGSEAEKSGNGLRIFARYLWDIGRVGDQPFDVHTLGGVVRCQIHDAGRSVTVAMGTVSFRSDDIPVAGPSRDVLNEQITVAGRTFDYCAATVGNPHCVLRCDDLSKHLATTYGPAIETDPRFPNRTNVQFMTPISRSAIRIEIWERGAGYTLASGSSSCAAAAVARKLSLCDAHIAVHMPGGVLNITIDDAYACTMTGPVTKVAQGQIDDAFLTDV